MDSHSSPEHLMQEILSLCEQLREHKKCVSLFNDCVMESLGVAIVATNELGDIIYLNKKAEDSFLVTAKELGGKNISQVLPFSLDEPEKKAIVKRIQKGQSWEGELIITGSKGQKIFIYTVDTPVMNKNGNFIGMICVSYDISKQKEADQAVIENEEKYRNVVDNAIEGILIIQGEYCVYANQRALDMVGYTSEEAFNIKFIEFVHKKDHDKILENYKERLKGKQLPPYDFCIVKKDGRLLWVNMNATQIRWNSQIAVLCFISDITYRKEQEEELKNYNTTLKAMIENTVDYIMIADEEAKPVMFNENFKKIIETALDIEMKPGIHPYEFNPDNKIQEFWKNIHKRVLAGERVKEQIEIEIKNEKRFFEFSYVPLMEGNKVLGFCEHSRDITDSKRYEEELKRAKEKAEESDRLKSAFLANMSHEIRTPMNGIIGFSDLLIKPDLNEEKYTLYANTLRDSCYQLLNIVNDILDISRIETGQLIIKKENVVVNKILYDLFKIYKPSAEKAGLDLQLICSLKDEESILFTDEIRLRQVLTNLIGNALKYTSKGYIKFGYVKEDNLLRFFVEDSGIGIDNSMHKAVFERFRQADDGLAKKFSGTGLGLSISKGFVELLGGEIGVESTPNKGSIFYFTHPYKPLKIKIREEETRPLGASYKSDKSLIILVAEDEIINFLLMKEVLATHQAGSIIIHAKDGHEAIKIVEEYTNIDLVLMDIKMPNMDGYEATRIIKKLNPNLPVIAVTAYAMPEDEAKSKEAGCDAYISKPINAEKLFKMVGELVP